MSGIIRQQATAGSPREAPHVGSSEHGRSDRPDRRLVEFVRLLVHRFRGNDQLYRIPKRDPHVVVMGTDKHNGWSAWQHLAE